MRKNLTILITLIVVASLSVMVFRQSQKRAAVFSSHDTRTSDARKDHDTNANPSLHVEREQVVSLTTQKLAAAGIQTAAVEMESFTSTTIVPARITYDQDRHVDVKSACEGIVFKILVRPGDRVEEGEVVAVITSPEVGNARSRVQAREADERLAFTKMEWHNNLQRGVRQLVQMIRAGESPDAIKLRFVGDSLGDYRQRLIEPYVRSLLAEQLANSSRGVADLGGIPGRVQRQRESDLQTAEASLESILDQVEFDARRESDQATAAHRLAAQQLMVARQELNSILGPASDVTVELADAEEMTEPTLSRVALRAPIEGTIQDRLLSNSERVAAGQVILVIADTTNLWVEADVRENDWLAMEVDLGQPVEVLLPAIPDRQFVANILIVGRRINTSTGAAQLVARLQQTDARLRPGLFARMIVPHGQPRRLLTVQDSSVVVHEGQSFVFVQTAPSTFRRVNVETGESQNGRTVIVSGLDVQAQVVVKGAFLLKSELLLAGTEE